MLVSPFSICTNRKLIFNPGSLSALAEEILLFGKKTVVFTGGASLKSSGKLDEIKDSFNENSISAVFYSIDSEPSPETR